MARGERIFDTDRMAIEARAKYALDPVRWERGMAKVHAAPEPRPRAGPWR